MIAYRSKNLGQCLRYCFARQNAVLTHLSLFSHKWDIGKQCRPRSDAAKRGVWSGSTLFALSSKISTKHANNKKTNQTPLYRKWTYP